jgi:hypothetical protein
MKLGMAVRVRVLGNPRVLHPRVRVQVHFYTRDPNPKPTRAEPSLGAGFVFHPPTGAPETRKKPKKPERNQFIKPDGHPNLTQNPMGRVPNFTRGFGCQIQPGYIFFADRVFSQPDPNPIRCHP